VLINVTCRENIKFIKKKNQQDKIKNPLNMFSSSLLLFDDRFIRIVCSLWRSVLGATI